VRLKDPAELENLLSAADYDAFIAKEANDEALGP
jgi:hypothetical protein